LLTPLNKMAQQIAGIRTSSGRRIMRMSEGTALPDRLPHCDACSGRQIQKARIRTQYANAQAGV